MRLALLIAAVLMLLVGGLWLARPRPLACPKGRHADPDRQVRLTERLRTALSRMTASDAHILAQTANLGPWCLRRCSAADLRALGHFTAIMDGDWFTDLPGFSQVLNANIVLSEMSEPRQPLPEADETERRFATSEMASVRE